jgi:hypothetical protein
MKDFSINSGKSMCRVLPSQNSQVQHHQGSSHESQKHGLSHDLSPNPESIALNKCNKYDINEKLDLHTENAIPTKSNK